jgi:hypothetical protein
VDALHVATAADDALDAEAGRRTHCLRCTTAPRPDPEARRHGRASETLPQHWHRYQQVRDTLTLYRLAFGQPRQEDLIELLRPPVSQKTTADGTRVLVNLAPTLEE